MSNAPDPCAEFSPLVRQVVSLVGRRSDDPALVAFFTNTLGKNPPATKTDSSSARNVVAKKHGLEFAFDHDVKHDLYPLVKTKKSFVPYLSYVWLTDEFPEPLPFDLVHGLEPDEITKRLGVTPTERGYGEYHRAFWSRVLDAPRAIVFSADATHRILRIDEASKLSAHYGVPAQPVVGLFVAWAAQHGLLDPTRAGSHAALLEEVRTGTRRGSELLDAAYPRGLWDVHLIDRPGLRRFAYQWFHNIGGTFIRDDLVAVFGGRKGPYGHEEPALDTDDAAAVKRATPKLDTTFAPWLE
jgi:hypothetical protein